MSDVSIPTWLAKLGLSRHEAAFVENEITVELLPALTHEELKALGVGALGERMLILAAAARLVPSNPLEPLAEQWPSVLAIPLREYLAEENPVLKLWLACDVVEMLLRFTVMLGVAEARRDGELPEDLVRQLADRIEHPTLGKWQGMAQAVVRGIEPGRTAIPELRPFLEDVIAPLLDGAVKPPTAESSFTRLRNTLAHGGGLTKSAATRLLKTWQARFEVAVEKGAWLGDLSLRVRDGSGSWGELRGATATSSPVGSDPALPSLRASGSESALFVVRGGHCLELWPLAWHGESLAEDLTSSSFGESPQVYVRRGEVRLEYTPVGSKGASQSAGEEGTLSAFLRLFLPEKRDTREAALAFVVKGFEKELRKDASQLVGRAAEVETLRELVRETSRGVIWVSGQAGVGKSFVVAKVTSDLLDEAPEEMLVLPYRFKAGDGRCSRETFLQFCLERLAPWVGEKPEPDGPNELTRRPEKPLDRLEALLQRTGSGRRIVFVLDGLDEISERDPAFAREIPLALRHKGVLWLCAGRPERGLPEAFEAAKALVPFPGGLPLMSETDIREMLLEKTGPLRKKLIRGDREAGDRILNPFVERVAKCSAGLPIYVKYVVGDVLAGRISPDEGARLPPSLAKYHEELLRRCAVGDLHQVVTPLVATLAVANEPLTQDELTALLARRACVTGGAESLALVGRCLSAVASMVRLAPDPDGGDGYTLWHHSLRQHILESPETRETVATARRAMAEAGLRPAGDAAEKYLFRQGITHLLEQGRREEALVLMTDSQYLPVRLAKLGELQEPGGLVGDWCSWLIPSENLSELEAAARGFAEQLESVLRELPLADSASATGVFEGLLEQVASQLTSRLGGAPGLRATCSGWAHLAQLRVTVKPESTKELRNLLRATNRMGDVEGRTDPAKARDWYLRGLDTGHRLVALGPENPIFLTCLSVSYDKIGKLDERTDPTRARHSYLKGLEIRQRVAALRPENASGLHNLSVSLDQMGKFDGRTDPARARKWYLESLAIRERLVALEPENTTFLRYLSDSFSNLGSLDEKANSAEAREWFLKALEIRQRLAALEPENTTFQAVLADSYSKMGALDLETDSERARDWYLKELEIRQSLVALEPANTTFLLRLCWSHHSMGALVEGTNQVEARDWFLKGLRIRLRLTELEPGNMTFLDDLWSSYSMMGWLDLETDPERAREWFLKGLEIRQRLAALEPGNATFLRGLRATLSLIHGLDMRYELSIFPNPDGTTDPGRAREWHIERLEITQRLIALDPDNTPLLCDLSTALDRIGDLDRATDPASARECYLKGLEIRQSLVALEPENTTFLRDLSLSFSKMGDLDGRTDPARAREWFLKDLDIAQRLAALEPENTTFLRDLSLSFNRIGSLDEWTDPAKAREWFLKALEIRQRLTALEPMNTTFLRDRSWSFNRIGGLDERTDPAKAREWFLGALEITQSLAALEPENTKFMRDLAWSFYNMGDLDRRMDPAKARDWVLKGLGVTQRLAAVEPDNASFLNDLSVGFGRLGSLSLEAGLAEARDWFVKSLGIAQRLVAVRPGAAERRGLSICLLNLGFVHETLGEPEAETWYDQAIETRRELVGDDPSDADGWVLLGDACHKRGAWAIQQGRETEAEAFDEECLSALARAEELAPGEYWAPNVRASFQAVRGRPEEALQDLRRSVALGFADTEEILRNKDLESLRELPGFQALVEEMRQRSRPVGEPAAR